MKLAEFEHRIADATDALIACAEDAAAKDAFAVEASILQVFNRLDGCSAFATNWANEQYAELVKTEESRGHEVCGEGK